MGPPLAGSPKLIHVVRNFSVDKPFCFPPKILKLTQVQEKFLRRVGEKALLSDGELHGTILVARLAN